MISAVPDETQHVPDGPLVATPVPASGDKQSQGPALPARAAAPKATRSQSFGRYRASSTLGAGAMGTVYLAHDDMLGRDVAIKTLTASGELGVRERFVREARAIGAVHHPNILAVHDVGEQGTTPFLVMELAAGGSLRERIKGQGPLPAETVREIGIHIARALAAAHAAGIIHRDIKPANILCSTPVGHPPLWKLADFGIAHVPDSTLTMTGQFLGSPSYAAPESLRAGQFSPASDVYGLGATLYEALAGSPPHGDHDMQSLVRKLEHDAPPLQQKIPTAPRALADPIMAALATDPTKRPSAEELARALAQDDIVAAPLPIAPAATTTGGPSMKLLAVGLLAIAALALILALREGSSTTTPGNLAAPGGPLTPVAAPAGEPNGEQPTPQFVDQNGNPVDEETAKQILEQMEEDARDSADHPGRGRHGKKKKDD